MTIEEKIRKIEKMFDDHALLTIDAWGHDMHSIMKDAFFRVVTPLLNDNIRLTAEVERLKAEMARWKNELDSYYRGEAIQTYGKPFTEDFVHGRIDAVVHLSQLFFPETGLLQQPHPVRFGEYQVTHPEKFEASHPDIDEGETCRWEHYHEDESNHGWQSSCKWRHTESFIIPDVCPHCKRIAVKGGVK